MKTILAILILGAPLTGCYSKSLMLDAEVVSMTKGEVPANGHLNPGQEVEEKWCVGDQPALATSGDDKQLGLADQVIYKAQQARHADYLTGVQIYRDSKGCALLTGKTASL